MNIGFAGVAGLRNAKDQLKKKRVHAHETFRIGGAPNTIRAWWTCAESDE
jgi:hypothetical protein